MLFSKRRKEPYLHVFMAAAKAEQLPSPERNEKKNKAGMPIDPGPAAYATGMSAPASPYRDQSWKGRSSTSMYWEIADKQRDCADQRPRSWAFCIHKQANWDATGICPQISRSALMRIGQYNSHGTIKAEKGKESYDKVNLRGRQLHPLAELRCPCRVCILEHIIRQLISSCSSACN